MRKILIALAIVTACSTKSQAQYIFTGPGSTAEGDYLRGAGIQALGAGVYNEKSSIGRQIDTNTAIHLNEYLYNSMENEKLENAERHAKIRRERNELHKLRQERYRDNPEAIDVMNGNALNAKWNELLDPSVSPSALRYAEVPLNRNIIRTIPFKLGEKGEVFSMNRLELDRKNKWVPAFKGPEFAPLRRRYDFAVDQALDLTIQGKPTGDAIKAIIDAVNDLEYKLRTTPRLLTPEFQRSASEAKTQIDQLQKTARLFQTQKMRDVFLDIELYNGTTVSDFQRFIQKHNLSFAPAESADERELYPELFNALREQRDKITDREPNGKK